MKNKVKFQNTSMIAVNVGDLVYSKDKKRKGVVKAIQIVPNGNYSTDRSLVALLAVDFKEVLNERGNIDINASRVISTANNFEPALDYEYQEEYPSDLLNKE